MNKVTIHIVIIDNYKINKILCVGNFQYIIENFSLHTENILTACVEYHKEIRKLFSLATVNSFGHSNLLA